MIEKSLFLKNSPKDKIKFKKFGTKSEFSSFKQSFLNNNFAKPAK